METEKRNFVKNAPLTMEKPWVPGQKTALSGWEINKIPTMDTMMGKGYYHVSVKTISHSPDSASMHHPRMRQLKSLVTPLIVSLPSKCSTRWSSSTRDGMLKVTASGFSTASLPVLWKLDSELRSTAVPLWYSTNVRLDHTTCAPVGRYSGAHRSRLLFLSNGIPNVWSLAE